MDKLDAAQMATARGTVMFKDYVAPLDAHAIVLLRKAAAIILGKTTVSSFTGGDT